MWRCVQHLFNLSVNPQAPASDEPIEPHPQETPSTLDPIQDAGAVDLVTLGHAFNGIPIFHRTFIFNDGPEWIDRAIADANTRYPKPQFVHDQFTRDLANLTSWRAQGTCPRYKPDRTTPTFLVGGFHRAKNDVISRGVLNGNRFSRCCPASPPVNLIDLRGLRHRSRRTTRLKGRVRAIQGDFRRSLPRWRRLSGLGSVRALSIYGADFPWDGASVLKLHRPSDGSVSCGMRGRRIRSSASDMTPDTCPAPS